MTNWKTTVAGLIAAIALALANYTGRNDWQGYVGVAAIAALGVLSKDFNTHSTDLEVAVSTKQADDAALAAANATK
jgi:hypothetical protein